MATLAFNELMLIYKDLLTLPVQREIFKNKKKWNYKKSERSCGVFARSHHDYTVLFLKPWMNAIQTIFMSVLGKADRNIRISVNFNKFLNNYSWILMLINIFDIDINSKILICLIIGGSSKIIF